MSGPAGAAVVHPTAIVDAGAARGPGTRSRHISHVSPGARIGAHCTLGQNVFVAKGVTIGDHVKLQNNVSVYEGVTLEDYVFCGPNMTFTNVRTPRSAFPRNTPEHYRPTLVRRGATLGANCTIVCGATIGPWGFVAAGAVVTKDVPAFALMAGVPARRVGWACACGETLPKGAPTACAACHRRYRLAGEVLEALEALP